jgi:hypothetical protein
MGIVIKPKRSEVTGAPTSEDLEVGEIAVNLADGTLFSKNSSGTVVQLKSYDADLFSIPNSVDLGNLSTGTVSRDLGTLA